MNQIIQAVVLLVVAFLIISFLIPLLTGIWHTVVLVVVVIGAILGLMKIAGMWF